MVDVWALKGAIKARGLTISDAAKAIGISDATMTRRLRNGVFGSDEMEKLADLLRLESPEKIFFARK